MTNTKFISFVSQKGGVGKTTSAVNLATAFAFSGYSVLLIDLDPQSSVRSSLSVKKKLSRGTAELFLNPQIPLEELTQTVKYDNLDFIFSNINSIAGERRVLDMSGEAGRLDDKLKREAADYDFVIMDAPSSTNNLSVNAIYCAELTILPLQCESLAINSLKRFLVVFNELKEQFKDKKDLRLAGILLTMYDRNIEVHRRVSKQLYQALSDSVFDTIIPRNTDIIEAGALGKSVINHKLRSIGSTAYIRLMNELIDKFSSH